MEGSTGSRLDRLFLTEGAIDSWKVVGQKPSQRNILDHCPIWIIANDIN